MFQLGKEHPPTKKEKEKKVQVAKFIYFTSNNIFQWEKRDPYRELKKKKRFRERNKNKFSLYNFSANYKQKVENRIKALFNLYIMTQLNN